MYFKLFFLVNNNGVLLFVVDNVINSFIVNGGLGFVFGLFGGGNKNEILIFNLDFVNNVYMYFVLIGVNN